MFDSNERKKQETSEEGPDRTSTVDTQAEPRGLLSCWNKGQNSLCNHGFASGWKSCFKATTVAGMREPSMMEGEPDTYSQHKFLPSRAGSDRCDKMSKKMLSKPPSFHYLFWFSVCIFLSDWALCERWAILREGFVKTQAWHMPWKWINEHEGGKLGSWDCIAVDHLPPLSCNRSHAA